MIRIAPDEIISKISKIKFPELCPVCLAEPEDLVSVTINEENTRSRSLGYWGRYPTSFEDSIVPNERAVTFLIPTCLLHGSASVRTSRNRVVTVLAFFILFYPILYMYLQINVEASLGRPIFEELLWLAALGGMLIGAIIYGYYPRALERAIVFVKLDLVKDLVTLKISNMEYLSQFRKLNEMYIQD
jgi:hypothetical protein